MTKPKRTAPRGVNASLPAIADLAQVPQWVCWRFEDRVKKDGPLKPTKVPVMARTGRNASTTSPATWTDFQTAHDAAPDYDGAGFVVTGTVYCGVDLDHCLTLDGTLAPWGAAIVAALDSYTEVTPSGDSVRVWVRGAVPEGSVRTGLGPDGRGRLEIYSGPNGGRFFTVTQNHLPGTPREIYDRQTQLDALFTQYWPDRVDGPGHNSRLMSEPAAPHPAPPDIPADRLAALLDRIGASQQGPAFAKLWNGDIAAYDHDDSRADLALCSILAFWCGRDAALIDAVFRQSKLMRGKWSSKRGRTTTYGARTIARAIDTTREVYSGPHPRTDKEPDAMASDPPPRVHASVRTDRRASDPASARDGFTASSTRRGLPLQTFKDFVETEIPPGRWVVDGLFPVGGVSEIVAKPKVGKSTLMRSAAAAVVLGRDFLGRTTLRGPVIYLCFEPSQAAEVKAHFLRLGVPADDEQLHILVAPRAPEDFHAALRISVADLHPVLVVVDMLINVLTTVVDIADYVEMFRAMEPFIALAAEGDTHIALLHHGRKAEGEDGDVGLGSTAIFGNVDTGLFLAKKGELRTLKSSQRGGEPFTEPVRWFLDATTGGATLAADGETPVDEAAVVVERIRRWLERQTEPATESAIRAHVRGRNEDLNMALRRLVHAHQVVRTGEGGRKDPYRYAIG